MMRRSTILWSLFAAIVATGLFLVKHRVHDLEGKLAAVQRDISESRDAIRVLHAEWSHLNRPSRLEDLGRRVLKLIPVEASQTIGFGELNQKLATQGPDTAVSAGATEPGRESNKAWVRTILHKLEQNR